MIFKVLWQIGGRRHARHLRRCQIGDNIDTGLCVFHAWVMVVPATTAYGSAIQVENVSAVQAKSRWANAFE